MPIRYLNSSVLRWPDPESVLQALRRWAHKVQRKRPAVLRIGYFGSYARGQAGVGSDLDVIVIVEDSERPFAERRSDFNTEDLPVPTDVLVYTQKEWDDLTDEPGFQRTANREAVWVYTARET